ncbi:uncharacterized protein [Triticum aestivum]|uniref:uncharacterized protein isoform X2 n=1 Tax=Triticum aestivum TaxID=4565 RepID=UPI001D005410|nr:uncharacterized protein LOC123104745 isoform X2 [Triticum aestivum]
MERLVFTGTAAAQIGAEVAADRGDEGGRAAAVERGRRHGGPWSWDRVLASAPNRSTLLLPRPPGRGGALYQDEKAVTMPPAWTLH